MPISIDQCPKCNRCRIVSEDDNTSWTTLSEPLQALAAKHRINEQVCDYCSSDQVISPPERC